MTESMIVEAVRAAGAQANDPLSANAAGAVSPAADPQSVARFRSAMGVDGADPVPFLSEVSAAWKASQANHQGLLHRIRALNEMREAHGPTSVELVELQYDVMNLSFQQSVVSKVADKASNAVQTLIKNQ